MLEIGTTVAVTAILALSAPSLAQTTEPSDQGGLYAPSYNYDLQKNKPWSSGNYYEPRPAAGPYDKPTLTNPAPVIYGKKPTFGDPRPYRNTNPNTCTSLLCD